MLWTLSRHVRLQYALCTLAKQCFIKSWNKQNWMMLITWCWFQRWYSIVSDGCRAETEKLIREDNTSCWRGLIKRRWRINNRIQTWLIPWGLKVKVTQDKLPLTRLQREARSITYTNASRKLSYREDPNHLTRPKQLWNSISTYLFLLWLLNG